MAHYNMKWGSPLLEDSLCTVRLHGSPGPLPSRPLVASFHSSAPPPSSVSSLSFPPPPPRVFIDLMAGLASPCRRLAPSQQRASSPSFLASAPGRSGVWACLPPATSFLGAPTVLHGFVHLHVVSGLVLLQTLGGYPSLERGRDFVPCDLADSSVTSLCDASCGMSSWVAIVVNPGAGDIRSLC